MARSPKEGLEYFPLDTDIISNDKIALIEADFGSKGFAIVIKLLCLIYKKKGYYMHWEENTALLLAKPFGESGGLIGEVVLACIKRGLFKESVFNACRVLTSAAIQDNYLNATIRRTNVLIEKKYCLVDICVYKNAQIVDINSINAYISTQSIVEYSKVEESREEQKGAGEDKNFFHSDQKEKKSPPVAPPPQWQRPTVPRQRDWADQIIYPFASVDFATAWDIWIQHLGSIGRPYQTRIAEEAAIKLIGRYHEPFAIHLIEKAVASGTWVNLVHGSTEKDYRDWQAAQKNKPKNEQRNEQFLNVAQHVARDQADPARKNQFDY